MPRQNVRAVTQNRWQKPRHPPPATPVIKKTTSTKASSDKNAKPATVNGIGKIRFLTMRVTRNSRYGANMNKQNAGNATPGISTNRSFKPHVWLAIKKMTNIRDNSVKSARAVILRNHGKLSPSIMIKTPNTPC